MFNGLFLSIDFEGRSVKLGLVVSTENRDKITNLIHHYFIGYLYFTARILIHNLATRNLGMQVCFCKPRIFLLKIWNMGIFNQCSYNTLVM